MGNIKTSTYRIAFCGIICALSIVVMFISIVPGMTYALPAVSGILIWTVSEQINKKWGMLSYAACSLLSIFLIPEPEATAFFISFFGYYPLLRDVITKMKHTFLRPLLKLLVFNITAVVTFQILSFIIGLDKMLEGMEFFGNLAVYALWISANIAFFCYDICLTQLNYAYIKWLKPRFIKRIH